MRYDWLGSRAVVAFCCVFDIGSLHSPTNYHYLINVYELCICFNYVNIKMPIQLHYIRSGHYIIKRMAKKHLKSPYELNVPIHLVNWNLSVNTGCTSVWCVYCSFTGCAIDLFNNTCHIMKLSFFLFVTVNSVSTERQRDSQTIVAVCTVLRCQGRCQMDIMRIKTDANRAHHPKCLLIRWDSGCARNSGACDE